MHWWLLNNSLLCQHLFSEIIYIDSFRGLVFTETIVHCKNLLNVVIFCGRFLFTNFKCITKNNLYMQLYILSVFVAIYKLIIGKRLSQISIPHIIWWYFKRPYQKDFYYSQNLYLIEVPFNVSQLDLNSHCKDQLFVVWPFPAIALQHCLTI